MTIAGEILALLFAATGLGFFALGAAVSNVLARLAAGGIVHARTIDGMRKPACGSADYDNVVDGWTRNVVDGWIRFDQRGITCPKCVTTVATLSLQGYDTGAMTGAHGDQEIRA